MSELNSLHDHRNGKMKKYKRSSGDVDRVREES
jgi:hypothetical protein